MTFMPILRRAVLLMACAAGALFAAVASAQSYPSRPIRLIVPFPPGGPADIVARNIAPQLAERLGQQVVVDNRGGAGGNIGTGLAARATPDGHTILLVTSNFMVNLYLYSSVPYDPYKDFIPISNLASMDTVYTAHPSAGVKSIADMVAQAKANPGKLSMATSGIGTLSDLSARLLSLTVKVEFIMVPYAGAGPAIASVLGNQSPFGATSIPPTIPHVKAGRLRGLAVTAPKRSHALPDVPTLAELGYPGQEAETMMGVLVPAGTPKPVVDRLVKEFTAVVQASPVRDRLTEVGFSVVASTPQQFQALIKSDAEKWGKVIRSAGLKVD
jgi:tripartite-type tricarboxylate transporter receptor subunit TctC